MLNNELILVVISGTVVIIGLVLSIVFFLITYNNKILKFELERQKKLIDAEIRSKETERIRIAREIHDAMSSNLTAVNLLIQNISTKFTENEHLNSELKKMRGAVEETHKSVRNIAKDLLANDIDVFGLIHAVNEMLNHSGLNEANITVNSSGNNDTLAVHEKVALYRIIQEILSNAIHHSQCGVFAIHIDEEDENITIQIEFDGTTFDFDKEMGNSEGLGLQNIESRIRYLKGNIKYHNKDFRNFYKISIPKDAKY